MRSRLTSNIRVAMRPCLISVCRRRLKSSTLPSAVNPAGSQNPTGSWTPSSFLGRAQASRPPSETDVGERTPWWYLLKSSKLELQTEIQKPKRSAPQHPSAENPKSQTLSPKQSPQVPSPKAPRKPSQKAPRNLKPSSDNCCTRAARKHGVSPAGSCLRSPAQGFCSMRGTELRSPFRRVGKVLFRRPKQPEPWRSRSRLNPGLFWASGVCDSSSFSRLASESPGRHDGGGCKGKDRRRRGACMRGAKAYLSTWASTLASCLRMCCHAAWCSREPPAPKKIENAPPIPPPPEHTTQTGGYGVEGV